MSLGSSQQLIAALRQHRLLVGILGGTAIGNFAYYVSHSNVSWYRAFKCSCTKEGTQEMLMVPEDVKQLLKTAADKLEFSIDAKPKPIVFTCRGHDPVRFGRLHSRLLGPAYLGVPEYFNSTEQAKASAQVKQVLYFKDRLLSLNTKRGKQLYEQCLLLDKDEKLFVLARELAYLNTASAHSMPAVFTLGVAGFSANLHWLMSDKGEMLRSLMSRSAGGRRRAVTVIASLAMAVAWSVMSHQWYAAYCKSCDAAADAKAAAAFPAGAVSYYEKMLKRNMLLRSLLGDEIGSKHFSIKGNEVKNWLLSDPFMPANQRCSRLKHTLAQQRIAE